MTKQRNESHEILARAWATKNAGDCSVPELMHIYAKAFKAIEQRCLATLSEVTVSVVMNRVLYECQATYPLLDGVEFTPLGLVLIDPDKNVITIPRQGFAQALLQLMVELLNVIGNITADILTDPLHKTLMAVDASTTQDSPLRPTLRSVTSGKKPNGGSV